MWIKQQGFNLTLPTKLPSLLLLTGQEIFLVERFKQQFKQAWLTLKKSDEPAEVQRHEITLAKDWENLSVAVGNYSLFTNRTILEVSFDKKSLDKEGKKYLEDYLKRADASCLVLLHAPQLTTAALKFLSDDPRAALVGVKIPDKTTIERWISEELRVHYQSFPQTLPGLINQYTQGNVLACSQVIQKIALAEMNTDKLSTEVALEHLENQCSYKIYELSDLCLLGEASKALLILRYALENRQELTLVLWIIAQEIRLLIQLHELKTNRASTWGDALQQLKIWSSRGSLYQAALKRLNPSTLNTLLSCCSRLDLQIKTTQSKQIDSTFELLVLSLCLGKEIGPLG